MLGWKKMNRGMERMTEVSAACDGMIADITMGMVAGTRVATPMGWRAVEAVAVGDQVLTFDRGMQTVIDVRRQVVWSADRDQSPANWPLNVPAGALGNLEEMTLLCDQSVLVESDTAEDVFGDPFAMITAAALDGFRGITRSIPQNRFDVISLHFAQDEVVFANIGALFFCPRATDIMSDLFGAPKSEDYTVLSRDDAGLLVEFLKIEDEDFGPSHQAAEAFAAAA